MHNRKAVHRLNFLGNSLVIFLGLGLVFFPGFLGKIKAAGKEFRADQGSKSIEIASYPKEFQERYEVFSKKCSKCHTLARPINTNFEPSRWKKYVKRMQRKPDSSLRTEDTKMIWEFLVFDTRERKSEFWKKLPPKEREIVEASIVSILKAK